MRRRRGMRAYFHYTGACPVCRRSTWSKKEWVSKMKVTRIYHKCPVLAWWIKEASCHAEEEWVARIKGGTGPKAVSMILKEYWNLNCWSFLRIMALNHYLLCFDGLAKNVPHLMVVYVPNTIKLRASVHYWELKEDMMNREHDRKPR